MTVVEICDRCLRRLGVLAGELEAMLEVNSCASNGSNEVGKVKKVEEEECIYCCGLFKRIPEVAEKIAEKLGNYELGSIQTGCILRGSIKEIDRFFLESIFPDQSEDRLRKHSIKQEVNDFLAEFLSKTLNVRDARREEIGDATVTIDAETLEYSIRITPIYIYGRYIKRVRNIPQTRWICSACNGRGCQVCGFSGKKYSTSVEELIGQTCVELTRAEDAILHGAGREDVDARMLGNGRPFILEIVNPRIRKIDLRELERRVNESARGKVSVRFLGFAKPKHVPKLKTSKFRKKYRAVVEFDRPIDEKELKKALEELSYRTIEQFTPERVEHRRANILRKRKTYGINLLLHRGKKAVIEIEADSGLYIKELVSGDKGRTRPSLSEIFNRPARVVRLDVIGVLGGLKEFEKFEN